MPQFTIAQAIELARQRQREGDLAEAQSIYRQILQHDPDQPDTLHLLGVMLFSAGDAPQAAELIGRAVAIAPQMAEFHNNFGVVLQSLGRNDDAEAQFRAAIAIQPNYVEALNNLGATVGEKGALTEAIALNQKAADLRPGYGDTYANLGNALMRQGRIDEAIDAYTTGLKSHPDLITANGNYLLCLHYQPGSSPRDTFDAHARWGRRMCEIMGPAMGHRNSRDPDRRLRIGYVSQDFRAHSVCYFILNALKHHNREQFNVFCYADVSQPDDMTALARAHADVWRPIHGMPPPKLAELIQQDEIDILIDLGAHTAPALLLAFALKPAPVQVTYLGYPNTTGVPRIDYRITDSLADPVGEADELSAEKLIRLDPCAWCFHPSPHAPAVSPPPSASDRPITFGTFNAIAKINQPLIALWAKVMNACPGSRLLIKAGALTEEPTRQRIAQLFAHHDIQRNRLDLTGHVLEPAGHLATYSRVDIALDTFPYHGTTTTCEALWMGVPVITLAGKTHASRVGVSLVTNAGLPDLIASNEDDYVNIAMGLSSDQARLRELREKLREQVTRSAIGDGKAFAQRLDETFRNLWQKWCAHA